MTRITAWELLPALALTFLAPLAMGQQSSPNLILLNGKIFTSDAAHPHVEALAIRDEHYRLRARCKEWRPPRQKAPG